MSSCEKVDAVVSLLGSLGLKEALSQVGDLTGHEECIAEGLQSTAAAGDWRSFQDYLLLAWRFHSRAMTPVLCDVLTRRVEEIQIENVIDVLAYIGDPAAVDALENALYWRPEWDEYHGIGVKAVWALADIGTPEALEILRDVASVGPVEIREWATSKLEDAGE